MHPLSIITTLSLVGMFDAAYLLYTRIAGVSIACGPVFHGCNEVAASPYSFMFGVPLSLWGLLFYVGVLALTLELRLGIASKLGLGAVRAYVPQLLLVATTLGVISSSYLTYLQAFVIHAWCMYCVFSACISLALFVVTLSYLQRVKK